MRATGLLVVVASLAAIVGGAQAFQVDGFRSGMPIQEAFKDEPVRGRDTMSYSSTNGGPNLVHADDRLCILGKFTPGDVHRFVELVNQRTSRHGPAAYMIHEEIMGNGNKFSQLAAKWRMSSDYTHVIISKVGAGRDNISDQYRDLAICPER